MMAATIHRTGKWLSSLGLVGLGWLAAQAVPALWAQKPANAPASPPARINPPAAKPLPATTIAADRDRNIVAYVNNIAITRQELAEDLIARRGKDHLPLLINRKIIELACAQAGVQVTDAEVEADLKDVIRNLKIDESSFEESVLRERKMTLFEYKEDVIRPAIAMRKLAGARIQVTDEDLRKGFEANYGEKVRCRVIIVPGKNLHDATKIHAEVKNDPEAFLRQAKLQANPTLAATAGLTRINRHSAFDNVEHEAFRLRDGEVSQVLEVEGGHVIMLREALEPADKSKKLEDVRELLRKDIAQKKLQREVPRLFKELKDKTLVRDYLNNRFDMRELAGPELLKQPKPDPGKPSAARSR